MARGCRREGREWWGRGDSGERGDWPHVGGCHGEGGLEWRERWSGSGQEGEAAEAELAGRSVVIKRGGEVYVDAIGADGEAT